MRSFQLKAIPYAFAIASCLWSGHVGANTALNCASAFTSAQPEDSTLVISLVYDPPLVHDGRTEVSANQVLIEVFDRPQLKLKKQLVEPYRDVPGSPSAFAFSKKVFLHEAGLKAIYENYGERVDRPLLEALVTIEKQLPLDRQQTVLVAPSRAPVEKTEAHVAGFLRIFDGTLYSAGRANRSTSSPDLPLERVLKALGKSTEIVQQKRAQGSAVYEIGKYFVRKSEDPVESAATRKALLDVLQTYIRTRATADLTRAFFFAHVSSEVHSLSYRRNFSFQVVPRDLSSGLESQENILMVRGDALLKKLEEIDQHSAR